MASARFFNLKVASEVIAVNYFMNRILDDTKKDDEWLQDIHVPCELKKKYIEKVADEREQMGWSLLTTLACLHIIKNSIS